MQFYKDFLTNSGYKTTYIDSASYCGLESLFRRVLEEEVSEIHVCDPVDYLLLRRLKRFASQFKIKLCISESPNFINSQAQNDAFFSEKKTFFMADFYKHQRQRLNILMQNNKPVGGKWSFDSENRKSLSKSSIVPPPWFPIKNQYVARAIEYIDIHFENHPGNTTPFAYPVTFEDAEQVMEHFFRERFSAFGVYQDAFSEEHPFLFHSLLSAPLNCGLLTPEQLVERALLAYETGEAPLNSVEGFIRQVIGWREFVRAVYVQEGVQQRTKNHWNFSGKLSSEILKVGPIASVHSKLQTYAYGHHIERLMVLGNFFMLNRLDPNEVYTYFMTYFIDAYDWVMVPNVYGMVMHADGGLMTTKPYISSSNYLKKQGMKIDVESAELWDALYWKFIYDYRSFFESNYRMMPMVFQLNRMKPERIEAHLNRANSFLKQEAKEGV